MFRLLFVVALTVTSVRWIYAEIQLSFPRLIPFIDYALELTQIPTHDKWDFESLQYEKYLQTASKINSELFPQKRSAERSFSSF